MQEVAAARERLSSFALDWSDAPEACGMMVVGLLPLCSLLFTSPWLLFAGSWRVIPVSRFSLPNGLAEPLGPPVDFVFGADIVYVDEVRRRHCGLM